MEHYIIPQMWEVFIEKNPDYLGDQEFDFKPLRQIAEFLMKKADEKDYAKATAKIMQLWEPICEYISKDIFYSQKSLKTIANYIQEITLKTLQGDKRKPGISTDKLKSAVNKRYPKR